MTSSIKSFHTEEQAVRQKAIIITTKINIFVTELKKSLQEFNIEVYITSEIPDRINPYYALFIINPTEKDIDDCKEYPNKKFTFIFFYRTEIINKFVKYISINRVKNTKVLYINTSKKFLKEDIDKIFWFTFGKNNESYLYIYHPQLKTAENKDQQKKKKVKKEKFDPVKFIVSISKPSILMKIILIFLLIIHMLFIPPLILSSGFNYFSATNLIDGKYSRATELAKYSANSLQFSEWFYQYARPTLLLFSIDPFFDDAYQINKTAISITNRATTIEKKGQLLSSLFFKHNKTSTELKKIEQTLNELSSDIKTLANDLTLLEEKIPQIGPKTKEIKMKLGTVNEIATAAKTFLPFFDTIFAKEGTKKYLLLFANNMELRPGGGFIGSFGVIKMRKYTIEDIQVYDVYDADGQLKAHVKPPKAIKEHLNQPHWFLRDSAFSPDFLTNYKQALFFLEKEMDMKDFDGGILLTTTTIQNILDAVGELYIPDFREYITKDNFYIKAQLYAEKDFFPGSKQKKRFLGSVLNQLLIHLETASAQNILKAIKKSFNEKQLVAYFEDSEIQALLDNLYWSGRIITPNCPNDQTENCITDYIFPYDANLGVNKANFFISRNLELNVNIDQDGKISNNLKIDIQNNSFKDIFPGGRYKNYFQTELPYESKIRSIRVDNKIVQDYDESTDINKNIGFLIYIQPQSKKTIEINYDLDKKMNKGTGIYQLILQKQVGSSSSDTQILIEKPSNIQLIAKNFNPLVKENKILYNTTLSTDKIFVLEFFKE